eukprot:1903135-Rhodomonas_salina.2
MEPVDVALEHPLERASGVGVARDRTDCKDARNRSRTPQSCQSLKSQSPPVFRSPRPSPSLGTVAAVARPRRECTADRFRPRKRAPCQRAKGGRAGAKSRGDRAKQRKRNATQTQVGDLERGQKKGSRGSGGSDLAEVDESCRRRMPHQVHVSPPAVAHGPVHVRDSVRGLARFVTDWIACRITSRVAHTDLKHVHARYATRICPRKQLDKANVFLLFQIHSCPYCRTGPSRLLQSCAASGSVVPVCTPIVHLRLIRINSVRKGPT